MCKQLDKKARKNKHIQESKVKRQKAENFVASLIAKSIF